MKKYIPDLMGRDIVMISDFVDGWREQDKENEQELLTKIRKECADYRVGFDFIEVKNLKELEEKLSVFDKEKIVIFNWCEDVYESPENEHLIPEFLEKNGYKYTGADAKNILLTKNKVQTKKCLIDSNVNTPKYIEYKLYKEICEPKDLKYPLIVKLADEHLSVGISNESVVENFEKLKKQVKKVMDEFGHDIIVEEFIEGREFEVYVIGKDDLIMLPPTETDYSLDTRKYKVYTYDSKWEVGSEENINVNYKAAVIDNPRILENIERETIKAFIATGCRGYSRFDVRVRGREAFVIDINSNPYLNVDSSLFISSEKAGLNWGETIMWICETSL